jgi:hypothetical protein
MSEELSNVTRAESFDELYGVDGDGLGEGEVACEAELEYDLWTRNPSYGALMLQAKSRT